MQLNLPIWDHLADSNNILIAGAGGGFDVFAGLPIYFALRERGKTVHLANYSFTDLPLARLFCEPVDLVENQVMGARPPQKDTLPYFPEGYLSGWFQDRGEDITVWAFAKTGVQPLIESYRALVDHLNIDALILVDGGVDSLMRGDEAAPGTLVEDTITLAAVSTLDDVPVKILACLGFGTEIEEGVCHHHALENIAALAKDGAYWGSCALLPQMPAFQHFEAACRYVWDKPNHPRSHITTRVIPAAHGEFGNHHMYDDDRKLRRTHIFVSPLMSLYWFFDAHGVIARNMLIDQFRTTRTVRDAITIMQMLIEVGITRRPRQTIPY